MSWASWCWRRKRKRRKCGVLWPNRGPYQGLGSAWMVGTGPPRCAFHDQTVLEASAKDAADQLFVLNLLDLRACCRTWGPLWVFWAPSTRELYRFDHAIKAVKVRVASASAHSRYCADLSRSRYRLSNACIGCRSGRHRRRNSSRRQSLSVSIELLTAVCKFSACAIRRQWQFFS